MRHGIAKVAVAGEFDIQTAPTVSAAVSRRLAEPGVSVVMVVLTDVTFIDSSGLCELLQLSDAAKRAGKQIALARPSERVMHILRITALESVFTITDASAAD